MIGVSEVIAIILILMITISIAGLAYTFMSSTMASTTSAALSAVDSTTSSMLTSFSIESMDIAKVYVRNTGQNALSSLSVYVNDNPANYYITPTQIAAGQVGTVTIYDFIVEGDVIKITSPNGFSASKKAPDPCAKAVGCWKFDEGSGMVAYDSSPYRNNGMLVNGTSWTSGKYGGALLFDGSNDYVLVNDSSSLRINVPFTISMLIKVSSSNLGILFTKQASGSYNYYAYLQGNTYFSFRDSTGNIQSITTSMPSLNVWHHMVFMWNGSTQFIFTDGSLMSSSYKGTVTPDNSAGYNLLIGTHSPGYPSPFNGAIDDIRIYNRAIY